MQLQSSKHFIATKFHFFKFLSVLDRLMSLSDHLKEKIMAAGGVRFLTPLLESKVTNRIPCLAAVK